MSGFDIEAADRDAYAARGERFVTHAMGEQLLCHLELAIMEISHQRQVIAEADSGRVEALSVAELRVQLDRMTAREKRWREHALELSSQKARASVAAFSDFCEGHKAGMAQR